MHNVIENSVLSPEKMAIAHVFGTTLYQLSEGEHRKGLGDDSLNGQRRLASQLEFQLSHTPVIRTKDGKETVEFIPDPDGALEAHTIVETVLFRAQI